LNLSTAKNPAFQHKIPINRPSNSHQINQQIGMIDSAHVYNQSLLTTAFVSIENNSNIGIENFSNNQRELELLKLLDTTIKWIVIPSTHRKATATTGFAAGLFA
jgi:hypothetical protein